MASKVRHIYVEEIEWLSSFGMRPEDIATRLCTTVDALARAMYREARPDLANPFQRVVNATRTHQRRTA